LRRFRVPAGASIDTGGSNRTDEIVVTFQSARCFRTKMWPVCVVVVVLATACGGGDNGAGGGSPSTAASPAESPAVESTSTSSALGGVLGNEGVNETTPVTETPTPTSPATPDDEASGGTDVGDGTDTVFTYEELMADGDVGANEPPPLPSDGVDAYLGGSPDLYSATAIKLGLEAAGVDLTGVAIHVLPVLGQGAALLVLEVDDAYVETSLLGQEEGADIAGVLLGLPEVEAAAIAELVTIYRSVDEQGPFTMTFVVSMDALEEAYATGGDLGNALLVQVDRAS